MALGYKDLLARADAVVQSIEIEEALHNHYKSETILVDIRDIREREREGFIPHSRHAPRGMLEFWIDPESPYHKPWFGEDKLYLFYCASGWRSLLAAEIAQAMGLNAASLRGGFGAWRAAGHPVEEKG